jgi:hypothetical protein
MNHYIRDLLCGSISGMVGVIAGHPLDTIKCRMQLATQEYKGLTSAFIKIVQEEKFFALYKGIVPPLLSQVPLNAM